MGKIKYRKTACPRCGRPVTNNALGRSAHMRACKGKVAYDKLKLIEELRGCDHGFLGPAGVEKFAKGFGVTLIPTLHKADPTDPKGLTFADGRSEGLGMDAARMAEGICNQLGVEYRSAFGRGSQLRFCCDALEAHFK